MQIVKNKPVAEVAAPEPVVAKPAKEAPKAARQPEPKPDTKSDKPKKKGWWSLGR